MSVLSLGMEAKELRIGNYIVVNGHIIIVEDVLVCGINLHHDCWLYDIDELEPITLTEEILLKCGFEIKEGRFGNEYHLGTFVLFTSELLSISFVWDNFIKDIKSLHQLQNLFYALTGEELEINL